MNCDNCGRFSIRDGEALCIKCKPITKTEAEAAIDAAYWRFCRQARALPPVLACPEAYEALKRLARAD